MMVAQGTKDVERKLGDKLEMAELKIMDSIDTLTADIKYLMQERVKYDSL